MKKATASVRAVPGGEPEDIVGQPARKRGELHIDEEPRQQSSDESNEIPDK
jgi:hypothetical protein